MIDKAAGVSSAAPRPCPARAATRAPADGASPLASDAAAVGDPTAWRGRRTEADAQT
jgi:hypothetical protein